MPLKDLFPKGPYIDPLRSWIEPDDTDRWGYYADGFSDAAQLLVKQLYADAATTILIDGLVYPIVFLYRHAAELYIKHLINSYSVFIGKPQNAAKDHKLERLWSKLQPLLREAYIKSDGYCGLDEEHTPEVAEGILFIHRLDGNATTFRYPTDQDGNASLGEQRQFALATFARVADYTLTWLDGLGIALDEHKRQLAEAYENEASASADNEDRDEYGNF